MYKSATLSTADVSLHRDMTGAFEFVFDYAQTFTYVRREPGTHTTCESIELARAGKLTIIVRKLLVDTGSLCGSIVRDLEVEVKEHTSANGALESLERTVRNLRELGYV